MSEDHAVPPSPEEHRRRIKRLNAFIGYGFFVLVGILWVLVEFGGDSVQEVLGIVALAAFALWVLTWPLRKWREWTRRRRKKRRAA